MTHISTCMCMRANMHVQNKHAGLVLKYMHAYVLRFIYSRVHTNKHKHVQICLIWQARKTDVIAHTHSWCAPSLGKEFPSSYTNVHIPMSFFFCTHIYNHMYERPLGSHIRHTYTHVYVSHIHTYTYTHKHISHRFYIHVCIRVQFLSMVARNVCALFLEGATASADLGQLSS